MFQELACFFINNLAINNYLEEKKKISTYVYQKLQEAFSSIQEAFSNYTDILPG